jgi:hypothetical protein
MAGGLFRGDRKLQATRCHTTCSTQAHTHTHTHHLIQPRFMGKKHCCDVLFDDCRSKTMWQVLYEYLQIPPWVIIKRNISIIRHILTCKTTRVQYSWPMAIVVTVGWFAGRTVTITISGTLENQNCCVYFSKYMCVIYKCGREKRVRYPRASQKYLFSPRGCCRLPCQNLNNAICNKAQFNNHGTRTGS